MADSKGSNPEIIVPQIQQAELAGNYFSKHINFVIKVPGDKEVRRRFNDFFWLREWITDMLPGAFVPAIPEKLPIALWPQGYLAQRKRELQWFLKRCSSIPYIRQNAAYQLFLNSDYNTNFNTATKKFNKENKKGSRPNQLKNLLAAFQSLNSAPMPDNWEEVVPKHKEHVESVIECYTRMLANSEELGTHLTKSEEKMNEAGKLRDELSTLQQESIGDNKYMKMVVQDSKPDVGRFFTASASNCGMWAKCTSKIWVPVVKKNLNDLICIKQAMVVRDQVEAEKTKAVEVAKKWKTDESVENLRANQVDQKHRELDHEETLVNLYDLMVKIVFEHRKMIQQMNMDRWTSGVLTLQRHLVPKFEETKQAWLEARTALKEMVDDVAVLESADEEAPIKEAPKENTNQAAAVVPDNLMDDDDQAAYPVAPKKQEVKEDPREPEPAKEEQAEEEEAPPPPPEKQEEEPAKESAKDDNLQEVKLG